MKNRGYALKRIAFAAPALVLFALSGCSTRTLALGREQSGCDLSVNTVCARAIDSYLADETLQPVQVASSKGPLLVPIVAPATLPGGELAVEVDCYVDVDPNGFC
jgi:hypothetical protein